MKKIPFQVPTIYTNKWSFPSLCSSNKCFNIQSRAKPCFKTRSYKNIQHHRETNCVTNTHPHVNRTHTCKCNRYLRVELAGREGRTKPVDEDNAAERLAVFCNHIVHKKVKDNNKNPKCKQMVSKESTFKWYATEIELQNMPSGCQTYH